MIKDVEPALKSTVMEASTKDLGTMTIDMAKMERKRILMAAYIVAISKMIKEMDTVSRHTPTVVRTVERGSMVSSMDSAPKPSQRVRNT